MTRGIEHAKESLKCTDQAATRPLTVSQQVTEATISVEWTWTWMETSTSTTISIWIRSTSETRMFSTPLWLIWWIENWRIKRATRVLPQKTVYTRDQTKLIAWLTKSFKTTKLCLEQISSLISHSTCPRSLKIQMMLATARGLLGRKALRPTLWSRTRNEAWPQRRTSLSNNGLNFRRLKILSQCLNELLPCSTTSK